MVNKLLQSKTNIFQFMLATSIATALLYFTHLAEINIGNYSIDGLLGWALLVAFAGISSYRTTIPGIVVAIIWGILGGCNMHISVNIISVIAGMYAYAIFNHLRPRSPLNVYESAFAASMLHTVLTYMFKIHSCPNLLLFILLELLVTMGTFKAAINSIRGLGFINHEDPELLAKVERDYVQELCYDTVNKIFGTNFSRPKKPPECGK